MSSPNIRDIAATSKTEVTAVIGETRPIRAIRNVVLALTLTLIGATSMTHPTVAQAQATSPTTVKAGVTREQVMAVMPAEIRQTLQLYLNGQIRQ